MRKLLMVLAMASLAAPAMAASSPTCPVAPTAVLAVTDGVDIDMSWTAPACEGITKYAIEHTVEYYDPLTDPTGLCVAGTLGVIYEHTSAGAATSISFPLQPFYVLTVDPRVEWLACDDGAVRVKALTTRRGGSNRSQDNTFSAEVPVSPSP